MNESKEAYNFLEKLKTCSEKLSIYEDILSSQTFNRLKNIYRNLNDAFKNDDEEGRVMRIGVIGSVKAGKSSFLNALLFNGQNILPKAATPMTASLTKLCYSEKNFVTFTFYDRDDWEIIEKEATLANKYIEEEFKQKKIKQQELLKKSQQMSIYQIKREDIFNTLPDEQKACIELINSAKDNNLDVYKYLGKEETIHIECFNNIKNELEAHIGSNGDLSPIVKHVIIGVNEQLLRDLEIIDTPGLNDPITSRSQVTYRYLCQCDIAFLLSRAGQFLSDEDIRLLKRSFPESGITNVYVVASQMDLSVQNEAGKIKSYRQAYLVSRKHVKDTANRRGVVPEPICISSLMQSYAYKVENNLQLDHEDKKLKENIGRFEYELPETTKDFKQYSGINSIKKTLDNCRKLKDEVITKHKIDRIEGARQAYFDGLANLNSSIVSNKRLLQENDLGQLKNKKDHIIQALNSINSQIVDHFKEMRNRVANELSKLRNRILSDAELYDCLEVHEKTETRQYSHTSGHLWWKKTTYTTETTTTYSADLSEGLGNLRNYAAKSEQNINETFYSLLDKERIAQELKRTILPVMRNIDVDFDENIIINPVNCIINEINIPEFHFDNTQYNEKLVALFGNGILNEQVSEYKKEFQIQLQELCKNIRLKIENQQDAISKLLDKNALVFSQKIIESLNEIMSKLEKQMSNREEAFNRYDDVLKIIKQYQQELTR